MLSLCWPYYNSLPIGKPLGWVLMVAAVLSFTVTDSPSSVIMLKNCKSENKPIPLRFIFIWKRSVFETGVHRRGARYLPGRFSVAHVIQNSTGWHISKGPSKETEIQRELPQTESGFNVIFKNVNACKSIKMLKAWTPFCIVILRARKAEIKSSNIFCLHFGSTLPSPGSAWALFFYLLTSPTALVKT